MFPETLEKGFYLVENMIDGMALRPVKRHIGDILHELHSALVILEQLLPLLVGPPSEFRGGQFPQSLDCWFAIEQHSFSNFPRRDERRKLDLQFTAHAAVFNGSVDHEPILTGARPFCPVLYYLVTTLLVLIGPVFG